jgi:uncharacterized protein YraI
MHDYAPQHQAATCLSFKAGQVIHVLNRDASGWWDGELEGRRGWFPSNYVNMDGGVVDEDEEEEEDVTQVPVVSVHSILLECYTDILCSTSTLFLTSLPPPG